jgi:hypothetical protein
MTLLQQIQTELYTKTGKLNSAIIRRDKFKQTHLCKQIMSATSFLVGDACFASRVFCIENNITTIPICPTTNVPLKWSPAHHRFAYAAGAANSHKMRKANVDKISASLKAVKSGIKQSFKCKYVNNEYNLLSRDECINFINERLMQTQCGKRHNFVDTLILQQNHDACCSILYHTKHPLLNDDDINWSERFYLLSHNSEPKRCCNNKDVKAKYCNFSKGYNQSSSQQNLHQHKLKLMHAAILEQKFNVLNDVKSHQTQEYQLQCTKCGSILQRKLTNARWKDIFCAKCNGVTIGSSRAESEILEFLQMHCDEVVKSCRNVLQGKELDLYVQSQNFAIEYHGLLWHSFGKNYPCNEHHEQEMKHKHANKRNKCMQRSIHLLQIFENEWQDKQDIVKSIILSKLKKLSNNVYARNCKVIIASKQQKKEFLAANHLQGNDNSQIALALMHNNEIVAMMTFGSRQISAKKTYELIRFCCKCNTSVVGGASKLFKYFLSNYGASKITTYADLRYCYDGSFYKQLGFNYVKTTPPAYWYTDTKQVLHRFNFQKHLLVKQGYDANLTEREIMLQRGWRRIWDCGHMVFEYNK